MSEKSLEHFQQKVDNIKSELDKIKKETNDSDLEKKKQDIDKKIFSANEAIDDELSELKKDSDKNKETIAKLEELKKTLGTFAPELANLKQEVLDTKQKEPKEEGNPSLFAKIFYGGILGKLATKIPLVGDSIKDWADKKLKQSAEEDQKEQSDPSKEKSGFWSKAWKRIGGAALIGGAVAIGSKVSSSEGGFWNTIKGRFSSDKKNETQEDTQSTTPEEGSVSSSDQPSQEQTSPSVDVSVVDQEQSAQSPEEKADQEVQTMRSQGMSELYILTRMFELGYVPRVSSPTLKNSKNLISYIGKKGFWILDGGPLHSLGAARKNMVNWLSATIKYSKNEIVQQKLTAITKNPSLSSVLDKQLLELTEMEKFLATPNPDLKAFNKRFMGPNAKVKLQYLGKDPTTIKQSIETKKAYLADVEKHVKDLDKQILDIQKNAQAKLTEYDNLAKQHINDPKKLAEIRRQSQSYIKDYNIRVSEAQKLLLEDVAKVPNKADLLRMSTDNVSLSSLLKTNGGLDKCFTKISSSKVAKGAGKLGLALAVMKIVGGGYSDVQKQGFLTKETGMDALDLGAGLIPVAGGIYDLTMAIRGKDLNGRDMKGWERWVRGGVGVASSVVDVFTFGAGGTALRAISKVGLKTAVKATEKVGVEVAAKTIARVGEKLTVKTAIKGLQVGMQVASFGFLGYTLYQESAPVMISIGEAIDHKTESDVSLSI